MKTRRRELITQTQQGGGGGLPSEYQQVEYIESTGTQYIDTGIASFSGFKVLLDFEFTNISGNQGILASYWTSSGRQFYVCYSTNGNLVFHVGSSVRPSVSFNYSANTRYVYFCEVESTYQTLTVNNDEIFDFPNNVIYTNNVTLYLFASHDLTETPQVYAKAKAKMYNCIFYNSNNQVIKHFVPCYRKSDSVIGMYDLIEQEFKTNIGTGTFLKGGDV